LQAALAVGMVADIQGPDTRFKIILLVLMLSPILGWNGIIVALIVAFRHLRTVRISQSLIEDKSSFWVLLLIFLGYYITCVLTDLFHPNHLGYWNQFKVLIPLITTLFYVTHQDKIKVSNELFVSTARYAVLIIFFLTGTEYFYFAEIRNFTDHRSALLAGNPLHVSHWLPTLTLFSLGFMGKKDRIETLKSAAMLVLSAIALLYFLQARTSFLILMLLGIPVVLLQVIHQINQQWVHRRHGRYIIPTITCLALISSIYWLMSHHSPERLRLIFTSGLDIHEIASKDASLKTRFEYWKAGTHALKDSPIYGYGLGNENTVLQKYLPPHVERHRHAHQQIISFGIAGGFLAMIFGLLFIMSPIIYNSSRRKFTINHLHLSIFLAAPVMLNALTDSLLNNERHVAIFLLFFSIMFSVKPETGIPFATSSQRQALD
jgi:O-antigen ligase